MTPENFCYWLQGRVEFSDKCPTQEEWALITEHLKLVFDKRTPPLATPVEKKPEKLLETEQKKEKTLLDFVEEFNKQQTKKDINIPPLRDRYPYWPNTTPTWPNYPPNDPNWPPTFIC
jgi:hypothetical protein